MKEARRLSLSLLKLSNNLDSLAKGYPEFNPDQPRAEDGTFSGGGGSGDNPFSGGGHPKPDPFGVRPPKEPVPDIPSSGERNAMTSEGEKFNRLERGNRRRGRDWAKDVFRTKGWFGFGELDDESMRDLDTFKRQWSEELDQLARRHSSGSRSPFHTPAGLRSDILQLNQIIGSLEVLRERGAKGIEALESRAHDVLSFMVGRLRSARRDPLGYKPL